MKIIQIINPDNVSEKDAKDFVKRIAARAVVFDEEGKIALINVRSHKFHTLPGGGIEEGEDIRETLDRECEEEIGCDVVIEEELGQIIEHNKEFKKTQISYFFLARAVGEKRNPIFTKEEIMKGFAIEWWKLDRAITLFEQETHGDPFFQSIIERELGALKEVQKLR